jgi:hypothetical protein
MYSHCSIRNIPFYFCNIHIKHLQHTFETLKTHTYNMHFQQTLAGERQAEYCTRDSVLGRDGEGGWSRDTTEEVGLGKEIAMESAQGPPHG